MRVGRRHQGEGGERGEHEEEGGGAGQIFGQIELMILIKVIWYGNVVPIS